jgi:cellulose synthase/poly-beta-1,6-N-acetylglucosamine synthase-like glycosyltransferase
MERNVTGHHASTMAVSSTAYLEYEGMVDRLESDLGSVLICDGSVYCLRRSLFTDLDPDLANDLEHPIRAAARGTAILYEPKARSVEYCSSSPSEEFSRRRRIAAQGALAMWRLRHELRGFRLWQFLSRKFLRWLTVLPMAAALGASIVLRRESLFGALLIVQAGFYALAVIGSSLERRARANAILRMPFVFMLAHVAVFLGFLDACRQKTFSTWNTAELSRGIPGHTKPVTSQSST